MIDVNLQNKRDNTALQLACYKGDAKIVELLVKHNRIDTTKINNYCGTALYYACSEGYIGTVKILIASDRNLNVKQKSNDKFFI